MAFRFWDRKNSSGTTIRFWDDLSPYKKIYVAMGFYELDKLGEVRLELVPYAGLEREGAPPQIAGSYNSHKNICVFEIVRSGGRIKCVYDSNDYYYKVPNTLLRWCDLYFKSNFQESYLKTGDLLRGGYWDTLEFRADVLPEPLDLTQSAKFRRANFTMEMLVKPAANLKYAQKLEGLWHKTAPTTKEADLFFIGRYWEDTKTPTLQMLDALEKSKRKLLGGLVIPREQPPERYLKFKHDPVPLESWCAMAARARLPIMTRGLQGCVGFKPLNCLMIGAPFVANRLMSNLAEPLVDGEHYIAAADDFSDLGEKLAALDDAKLLEMGRRNLEHWRSHSSPIATARHILAQAEAFA